MLSLDFTLGFSGFDMAIKHTISGRGITAVFGPSGCGKSTLLRVIAGLEQRATARVTWDAEVWQDTKTMIAPHQRGVGMVFQDARLFPHLNTLGNLTYAAKRAKRAGLAPDLDHVIHSLDLEPLLGHAPSALSGGERQRVAMGRALLAMPRVLLMDEPLSALDTRRKDDILPYIQRLPTAHKIPVIYVSHAMGEVAQLADDIIVMDQGRVTHSGPINAVLSDPSAVHGMGLREAGSVIGGSIIAQHADGLSEVSLSHGSLLVPRIAAPIGTRVRVRIRAQDIILATARPVDISALNVLPVTIRTIRTGTGPGAVVQMTLGEDAILARITKRSLEALQLKTGQACFAILKTVAIAQSDVGPRGAQAEK